MARNLPWCSEDEDSLGKDYPAPSTPGSSHLSPSPQSHHTDHPLSPGWPFFPIPLDPPETSAQPPLSRGLQMPPASQALFTILEYHFASFQVYTDVYVSLAWSVFHPQLKALERQWQHLFSLNARHPVPTTVGHFTGSWMNEVCMSLQSPVIVLKKKKNSLNSCVTLAQTLSLHRDSEPLPAATSPPTGLQAQEHPHWAYNPPGTFPPPLHVHAKYCPWRLHGLLRCFIRAWIKCHSFRGVSADHPSWNSPRCPLLTPHSASLASTAFITTWHHVKL